MAAFPWFRFSLAATSLMGVGYLMMKATVPTEEQLYNEMAPDLRKKVDAARAARLAREAVAERRDEAQKSTTDLAPDATKPIWAERPQVK